MNKDLQNVGICVVGLGYVGLPLAVEFGKKYKTIGFDINTERILELKKGIDRTKELESEDILQSTHLLFSDSVNSLSAEVNVFIITVPTPIDRFNKPDLSPLFSACKSVGKLLKSDDIVIFESTVYPGCTEDDCVPVLEAESGLVFNKDFFCGYSPERINPGDKKNTLTNILKITSGSTPEVAEFVDWLYASIILAGTYKAPSIKVAEAAKIVENCQRDVNISFANELALIFERVGISTKDVLEAAATKWNFLNFKPGLVGGHCIGVDPYYMIHKAESLGYYPALIGAGRRINDNMGVFVANKAVKLMIQKGMSVKGARALIMGITFKENCPDIRNTKVVDIYTELKEFGLEVDIIDPEANTEEVKSAFGICLSEKVDINMYNLIILAVPHKHFFESHLNLDMGSERVIFDIKSFWPPHLIDGSL